MKLMVSPSVLGAATGVGMALLVGISLVIYRYYARDRKRAAEDAYFAAYRERRQTASLRSAASSNKEISGAPPARRCSSSVKSDPPGEIGGSAGGWRHPQQANANGKLLVLNDTWSAPVMASPPQQNFSIFREQPHRTSSLPTQTSSPPKHSALTNVLSSGATPYNTNPLQSNVAMVAGVDHVHVRLSLPDVHVTEEKVSTSQSSYSLPGVRRRSPTVCRARSVDARAMPQPVPRLSISDRSESNAVGEHYGNVSCYTPRTPSPEALSPFFHDYNVGSGGRPTSPAALGRPKSLSPLLSPAYSNQSSTESTGPPVSNYGGSLSPFGALQPDLYKKQDTLYLRSTNSGSGHAPKGGRLHFRLKYDFNRSDLVCHVIEAVELDQSRESGDSFSDPYVKVTLLPEVDAKRRQTEIRRNSINPMYDEIFKFPVCFEELVDRILVFQIYDYDRYSRNDVVGEVRVNLAEIDVSSDLEIWSEINKLDKRPLDQPEILLSLSYLPSAGRLTVVVLKACNLPLIQDKDCPDSYVKVALSSTESRKVKKKKTTTKKGTKNPVWNEALSFDVSEEELRNGQLSVNVVSGTHGNYSLKGSCVLGTKRERTKESSHWEDVLSNPRKSIAQWHHLHT